AGNLSEGGLVADSFDALRPCPGWRLPSRLHRNQSHGHEEAGSEEEITSSPTKRGRSCGAVREGGITYAWSCRPQGRAWASRSEGRQRRDRGSGADFPRGNHAKAAWLLVRRRRIPLPGRKRPPGRRGLRMEQRADASRRTELGGPQRPERYRHGSRQPRSLPSALHGFGAIFLGGLDPPPEALQIDS